MEARTSNIIVWVISAVLAAAFLMAGAFKVLVDPQQAAANFEGFGLPGGMATFIGVCEMAGGIGLLIPRLAGLAAACLVPIMIGAVYGHVTHDPLANALTPLVLGGLCAYVAWSRGLPFSKAEASA